MIFENFTGLTFFCKNISKISMSKFENFISKISCFAETLHTYTVRRMVQSLVYSGLSQSWKIQLLHHPNAIPTKTKKKKNAKIENVLILDKNNIFSIKLFF